MRRIVALAVLLLAALADLAATQARPGAGAQDADARAIAADRLAEPEERDPPQR